MQKQTLKLFWKFSNRYKIKRALALFFPVLAVSINALAAPFILSIFLNNLQAGTVTLENSVWLIAIYCVLLFVGEVIVWRLALYFTWTFEVQGQRDIYLAIFRKLTNETIAFHSNRFTGSLVSQSNKFIGAFERMWDMVIWNIIPMVTTVTGAVIILAIVSFWQYAAFLLIFALLFACVVFATSRFLAERNTQEAQASTKTSGSLADTITNIAAVKSFGREEHEMSRASDVIENWKDKSFHLKWGVIASTSIYASFLVLVHTVALVSAVLFASNDVVAVGSVYLVFIYTLNVGRQLWEMNNIIRTYNRVVGDAYDMTNILLLPNEIVDKTETKLHAANGEIDFDMVSFAHDGGEDDNVFTDFNLHIPAGQRIGLVGHSGSGKTTLTRILLRFSDITGGTISIDNQDISIVTQKSLHEAIAYVPQEPLLFHRSLRENIAYGKPDATEEEIRHAVQQANALEFIEKLPKGFDTLVGERGVKLSGGQRQRIAIARAILKDAPILVLDEATSALDSESEKLIQQALQRLMKGRTSIVIAHRLSTIAKLDRIIVLSDGKIVEDGTHSELLEAKGTYAKLWSHQSGGFIEE